MSTNETAAIESVPHGGIRKRRLIAVAAAVAAATVSWAVIERVGGVDLRSPAFDGTTVGQDVGLGAVIFTSLIPSLAAWGLLAALERLSRRPRRNWTILVVAGLVLSLGGPVSGTGIDSTDRGLLALLHLIVAVVLIPLLYRTAAGRNGRE